MDISNQFIPTVYIFVHRNSRRYPSWKNLGSTLPAYPTRRLFAHSPLPPYSHIWKMAAMWGINDVSGACGCAKDPWRGIPRPRSVVYAIGGVRKGSTGLPACHPEPTRRRQQTSTHARVQRGFGGLQRGHAWWQPPDEGACGGAPAVKRHDARALHPGEGAARCPPASGAPL
jgi:hypothetical protein